MVVELKQLTVEELDRSEASVDLNINKENMVGAEMEGAMMQSQEVAEMEGAMMQSKEVINELYDALIAQGLSPQEAMEKIKEIIASLSGTRT